ncbi:MAG: primosomal protein [Polaromonas sp.]|nr:primosomal protein [Polaromonas sp.]
MTPTLVASRTALPPEGAGLAWGGPALRPLATALAALVDFNAGCLVCRGACARTDLLSALISWDRLGEK